MRDARDVARALCGTVAGRDRVLAPGPGHSPRDRSLSVLLRDDAPDGIIVHSFAGDDPLACRDYVRERLGLAPFAPGRRSTLRPAPVRIARPRVDRDARERREVARRLWARALPGQGSLAERYLAARGLRPDPWPATIRFLPASPPDHLWPTLIAAHAIPSEPEPGILCVRTADVLAVQLTYLSHDGRGKAGIETQKRSVGRDHAAPIVLAPMSDALGLAIAEGIEDALSVHVATGLGAWAAGGASRMPALAESVPSYADRVTICADDDPAGRAGARGLRERLQARGIAVDIISIDNQGNGRDGSRR